MAGFNTAVTGIKAAQTDLDVTGNNIANASTVGFKSSKTQFGDIYATAVVGAGAANVAGSGITVTDIAQDFQAGTLEFTNNNLDLAINGSGFFQLDDGQGGTTYTRAGSFELNKDGFIVSKSGKNLQGYGLDSGGNQLPIGNLAVTEKESAPHATESISLAVNVDSRKAAPSESAATYRAYDKDNAATFSYSTTMRSFDSLGNEHTIKYNFVEQGPVRETQTLKFGSFTGTADVSGAEEVDLTALAGLGGVGRQETLQITADTPTTGGAIRIAVNSNLGNGSIDVGIEADTTPANASQQIVNAINFAALEGGEFDGLVARASYDGVSNTITIEYEKDTENSGNLTVGEVEVASPYVQFVGVNSPTVEVGSPGAISFGVTGTATEDGTITVTLPDLPTDGSAWDGTSTVDITATYEFGDTAAEISATIRQQLIAATASGQPLEGMVDSVDFDNTSGRLTVNYVESDVVVPQTAISVLDVQSTAQSNPAEPSVIDYPAAASESVVWNSGSAAQVEADKILAADERIASLEVDTATNSLIVKFKAEATDVDPLQFNNLVGGTLTSHTSTQVDANEVHTYQLNDRAFENGALLGATVVSIAGVEVQLEEGMDEEQIADAIVAVESKIIDAEPKVESVALKRTGSDYEIIVTFKPEELVEEDEIEVVAGSVGDDTPVLSEKTVVDGDNSYQGVYQMYAYLNGTETLDIGKVVDPGETGFSNNASEVGPILIKFDPSNGFLTAVNGNEFTAGDDAPAITITGADPADNDTTITLNITGSTQFASDSIVKSAVQDGYTKGDLIGVTFGETGEMIASFSNGQSQSLGVVAMATFENQAGLTPSGDTEWVASINSGDAILNPPGTGLNGTLQSAALEQSNVDLSTELVGLIEAQRNFQANSKTIETMNTITQNILQI